MTLKTIQDEDFVRVWVASKTVQGVADWFGISYTAAASRASKLRNKGLTVPYKHPDALTAAAYGRLGGKAKVPKGFAVNKELARTAGAIGGRNSRRGKAIDN